MRIPLLLFAGSLCGVFLPYQVSGACTTSDVTLKYNQLGQSWFVDASGDSRAPLALKGSPSPGAFIFGTNFVTSYDIEFTQPTRVESLEFQITFSASVTVEAYQSGSTSPDYTSTVTTGGSSYQLNGSPFNINLDNVVSIEITWTAQPTTSEIGIKKMFLVVCEAGSCSQSVHVKTSSSLTLPSGFSADVPGGPDLLATGGFSDNPVAVFRGSGEKIRLRSNSDGTNFISIESTSAFNVRTFDIKTRHGKGIYVEAYSDTAASDLLFNGTDTTTATTWTDLQVHASIGPINNVRRVDVHVMYDPDASDKLVNAKKLHFWTCS